ncbi:GntR family transcriptional regulator [Salipiger marinus]|uniref:GntR family transcriptional regulator n=1 Tax=Salipiger marinus TaxID=555512 RepID=A0A1G8RUI8_9RHOB|nr:GntR family transcriptional regulator [Salipiger marinus]SDJ20000.1 GntR family transcriptional regulator [Salipiger marinus]
MSDKQAELDQALERITAAIDRDSTVAVPVQLRGALEFGIASGELPVGARLPSVRALARKLRLSPVTVSNVYAALQAAGHIEGRVGSGTFVSASAVVPAPDKLRALEAAIADLIELGRSCGLDTAELATRVAMARPCPPRPLRLLMVGNFHDATEAYAADIRRHLRGGDAITAVTLDEIDRAPPRDVDLVIAPRTLLPRARALFPGIEVTGLTLIPNEATRVALATIPPEAEVVAYSYFPSFVTIMKANITRFAPHVSKVAIVVRGEDETQAKARIARASVLIYATGAEYLRDGLRPGQTAFEYRHTPDAQAIRAELLPLIESCRSRGGDTLSRTETKEATL